jgi:hypothetical protein
MMEYKNPKGLVFAAVSLAGSVAFAVQSQSADIASARERAAMVQRVQNSGPEFERSLTTTLEKESRDNAWSSQQESSLRTSYGASSSLPHDGLESIECRSSKCLVQVRVDGGSTREAALGQQEAVSRWISTAQPCGYTLMPAGNTGTLQSSTRIFLNCSR